MATNYKNFTPGLTSTKLPNTPEQKLEFFNSIDCTLSNPDDVSKITFAYESSYGAAYFSVSEAVSFTTLGEKVEFMVNDSHSANQIVNYSSLTDLGPSHIGTFNLSVSNRYYVKKVKMTINVNVYKTYIHDGSYWLKALMDVTTESSPSTSPTIYNVSTETAFPLIKKYTIPLYRVGNEGIRSWGWKKEKYSDDWEAYNWFEIGNAPNAGGMNYQFSDNNPVKKRRRDWNFCKEFPRFLYDNLGANEFVPISFVMSNRDNVACYFTKTYWPTSSIPSVGTWFAPNTADISWNLTSGVEKTLYLAITEPVSSKVNGTARGAFTRGAESNGGPYFSYEWFPLTTNVGKLWTSLSWTQPEMKVSSTGGEIYYIDFTDLLRYLYDTYSQNGDHSICIYMQRSSITVYRLGFRSPYIESAKIANSGNTYNWSDVFARDHITNALFDDMFGRATFDWWSSVGWTDVWTTVDKIGTLNNSTYYNQCVGGKSTFKMTVDFDSIPYAIDNPSACTLQLSRFYRWANPAKESKTSPHHGGMCTEVVWTIGMPFYMQKVAFKNTGNSPYQYDWSATTNNAKGEAKTWSTDTLQEFSYTRWVPQNISEFSDARRYTWDYRHRRENSGHVLVQHIAHLIGLYRTTDVNWYKSLEWTHVEGQTAPDNPLSAETKAPGLAILYMTNSTSDINRRYYHTNQSIILYRNQDSAGNYENSWKYSNGTGTWPIKYQINSGSVNTLTKGNSFGLTSGQTITFTFKSGSQRTYSYDDLVSAPDNRPWISGN